MADSISEMGKDDGLTPDEGSASVPEQVIPSSIPAAQIADSDYEIPDIPASAVATLIVDLWKIGKRANSEGASDRVIAACDRAQDRLIRLGFTVEDLKGCLYNTNLRVNVLEHEGEQPATMIAECISPAVYFNGVLVRQAEVITKGD